MTESGIAIGSAEGGWFAERVCVAAGDLDERDHVNNVVYVRWVQQIAIAHWRAVAPAEDQAALAWVMRRHEIDYHAAAILGDEVELRTRVGRAAGLEFERHAEIVRVRDGALLARSRTVWIPVDAASGRPRRVSGKVRSLFSR